MLLLFITVLDDSQTNPTQMDTHHTQSNTQRHDDAKEVSGSTEFYTLNEDWELLLSTSLNLKHTVIKEKSTY